MKRYLPYLKYFKPVRWHFFGGVVAGLFYAAASGFGLPLVTKIIFPLVFRSEEESSESVDGYLAWIQGWAGTMDRDTLVFLSCLWLPFIFLLRSAGGYFNRYLLSYCGFRAVEGVRRSVFRRMQDLPVSFYQKHQAGDLLARLTGDPEMLRQTVTTVGGDIIKQPATLLFALGYLIHEAIQQDGGFIVFISLLSIPLCVLPIRLVGKKLSSRARHLQNTAGDLSGQVSESLQAPFEIRAYNMQSSVMERFENKIKEVIKFSMKVIKYRQLISPSVELVAATGLAFALYLGAKQGMTLEAFMAIGIALFISYEPIKKLGAMHGLLKQGEAALNRIEEVLHAEGELTDPKKPKTPSTFQGEIVFDQVSFRYGEEMVLSDIDMKIDAGECVALVGHSGAGKSTFANLIPRFFDVSTGQIRVSGIDVRDWTRHDLRSRIALVSQTPMLFSGTIRENIRLGRPGASDAEVEEAAKKAYAHDFILEQENGYETEVAEKGTKVSGGQRQRIAIARAFLKDAPILILDEATSALDNESEVKIQEALANLVKGRTTLIIAHRLSTTKIADRIISFDRGRIVSSDEAPSD